MQKRRTGATLLPLLHLVIVERTACCRLYPPKHIGTARKCQIMASRLMVDSFGKMSVLPPCRMLPLPTRLHSVQRNAASKGLAVLQFTQQKYLRLNRAGAHCIQQKAPGVKREHSQNKSKQNESLLTSLACPCAVLPNKQQQHAYTVVAIATLQSVAKNKK